MWALLKKPASVEPEPADVQGDRQPFTDAPAAAGRPAAGAPAHTVQGLAQGLQQRTSGLGREAAEVAGTIADAIAVSQQQSAALAVLAERLAGIQRAQGEIGQQSQISLISMGRARETVEQVASGVAGIVDTLREVAGAAEQITQIALQTRLVAFNASVEAKRAGEAGRGFSVVADAVKELAGRVEASSKEIQTTVSRLDERIETLSNEIRSGGSAPGGAGAATARPRSAFHQALDDVESSVLQITQSANESGEITAGVDDQMRQIDGAMQRLVSTLGQAGTRSETFLRTAEQLMELIAECGVHTADTPYIELACRTAAALSQALEEALRGGRITVDALFDEHYAPVAGSNPAQHTTRFGELAERLFPDFQEPVLTALPKVVFCIAVDRNGYVAMHNRKYSQPQRAGDVVWSTAHSRWRRIFNDRTGLASGRNTKPFLLQTYRRDMGGRFVLLKEVAAPITVAGRHWGGLRLAYEFI